MKMKKRMIVVVCLSLLFQSFAAFAASTDLELERRKSVFVANGMHRLLGEKPSYIELFMLDLTNRLYQKHPNMNSQEAQYWLQTVEANYHRAIKASRGERTEPSLENEYSILVNVIGSMGPTGATAAGLSKAYLQLSDLSYDILLKQRGFREANQSGQAAAHELNRRYAVKILGTAFDLGNGVSAGANENSVDRREYVTVFNEHFADSLAARVQDSEKTILMNNPTLADRLQNRAVLEFLLQKPALTQEDLAQLRQLGSDLVRQQTLETRAELETVKAFLVASEKDREEQLRQQQLFSQKQRNNEEAARASIFLVSKLFEYTDGEEGKKAARTFSAVAGGVMDFNNAFKKFKSDSMSSGGAIAGAILSGNLLNIGMSIVGSMIGGPTMDEIMLQEVQAVRTDLAKFRTEMNERMNGIDQKLNLVLITLEDGFSTLQLAIGETRSDLKDVRNENRQSMIFVWEKMGELQKTLASIRNSQVQENFLRDVNQLGDSMLSCFQFHPVLDVRKTSLLTIHACLSRLENFALSSSVSDNDDLFAVIDSGDHDRVEDRLMSYVQSNFRLPVDWDPEFKFNELKRWRYSAGHMAKLILENKAAAKVMSMKQLDQLLKSGENYRSGLSLLRSRASNLIDILLRDYNLVLTDLEQQIRSTMSGYFAYQKLGGVHPFLKSEEQPKELFRDREYPIFYNCDETSPVKLAAFRSQALGKVLPRVVNQALLLGETDIKLCFKAGFSQHSYRDPEPTEAEKIRSNGASFALFEMKSRTVLAKPVIEIWAKTKDQKLVFSYSMTGRSPVVMGTEDWAACLLRGENAFHYGCTFGGGKARPTVNHLPAEQVVQNHWVEYRPTFFENVQWSSTLFDPTIKMNPIQDTQREAEKTLASLTERVNQRLAAERKIFEAQALHAVHVSLGNSAEKGNSDFPLTMVGPLSEQIKALNDRKKLLEQYLYLMFPEGIGHSNIFARLPNGVTLLAKMDALQKKGGEPSEVFSAVRAEKESAQRKFMETIAKSDLTAPWSTSIDAEMRALSMAKLLLHGQRPKGSIENARSSLRNTIAGLALKLQ